MTNGKPIRTNQCPIKQEYCLLSCYWRKGERCYFKSKHGRQIAEQKKRKKK